MGDNGGRELNATMRKFGAPATCIRDYRHWLVLLRPKQATLGAVILVSPEPVEAFPQLSESAFTELKQVTADLEAALKGAFGYDKLNYLMLMMVDADVHFHVLPRYAESREFREHRFTDPGWPGPPDLVWVNDTDDTVNRQIMEHIQAHWP